MIKGPFLQETLQSLMCMCLTTEHILIYLFIYLFMAVLGLRFCAGAFSSCGERGPLFIAVRGPLTMAVSLVAEHRLQTRRLSSCGSRAQLLRGMWDLPSPGLEPVSPALAGRFSTTAPLGKPQSIYFLRQRLMELPGEIDEHATIVGDFNPSIRNGHIQQAENQ